MNEGEKYILEYLDSLRNVKLTTINKSFIRIHEGKDLWNQLIIFICKHCM